MSQSPVSPTEDFEKMLSDFQSKTREHAEVWIRGENADAALDARIAARSALLSSYREMEARIERQDQTIAELIDGAQQTFEESPQGQELIALRLELSEARERQLTPEERDYLLLVIPKAFTNMVDLPALIAKLRASLPTPTSDVK